MAEPERLDLRSLSPVHEKFSELHAAIVEVIPEARTEDGRIDFDRLRLALGETVDVGRERYGITWPGKADCFKTIQAPSTGTLLPVAAEGIDPDRTEDVIIDGDNLEVLKLLQKAYLGKIKLIYIDPPYNTGKDFIYPDNYAESLHTYLEYTGQVDSGGRKFGNNTEDSGRFHSRWLNMMYPRLYLARNLLSEDGAIYISIDDHELVNLKAMCDDIFGEENFLATIIWQKVFSPKNTAKQFSDDHEYILVYAKATGMWRPELLERGEETLARYENPDNDSRGVWMSGALQARNFYSKGQYEVESPTGKKFRNPKGTYWRFSKDRFHALDADKRIWWGNDGGNVPRLKRFLSEVKPGIVPQTLWLHTDVGHTQEAKTELIEFVRFENTENVLNSVKPVRLIKKIIQISTNKDGNDIVLDFFSGSATTGHATLVQNQEDGGNRKYILVQLPEPLNIPEKRVKTIADLGKSRMQNVINKLNEAAEGELPLPASTELGFRVLKLAESNFKAWDAASPTDGTSLERQLELHVEHIRQGRSSEDILYEILLKSGFTLTTRVERIEVAGKAVYSVAGGGMLICLEKELSLDAIRGMSEMQPQRVICLDLGFAANDQLKANAVQIFKNREIVFKTV